MNKKLSCLALAGWSALTRLYPGTSKLNSSDKIPLSKNVSGRHKIHID